MNKLRALHVLTLNAVKAGHCGIFATEDLALMLGVKPDTAFRKYLYKVVEAQVLKKIATDVYYNPDAGVKSKGVLEYIAKLKHWNKFIYISLESELSHIGRISQIPMKRLTVMTTGRKGTVKTPFGVIEFIHTSRPVESLVGEVYFDPEVAMFRAREAKAIADLKRVGRNIEMLRSEEHA